MPHSSSAEISVDLTGIWEFIKNIGSQTPSKGAWLRLGQWSLEETRRWLTDTERINNKVFLYGTGNYIQYPVINHNGKDPVINRNGKE